MANNIYILGAGHAISDIYAICSLFYDPIIVLNQELPSAVKLPQDAKVLKKFKHKSLNKYCFGFLSIQKMDLLCEYELDKHSFPNIIHPSAVLVKDPAIIGFGNTIGPNVTIGADITIGDFNYWNRNSSVGHNTVIGNNNFFGPSCVICGLCNIGDNNYFGANSTLIDRKTVVNNITLGAGAVATKDLISAATYVGIPAEVLIKE